MTTDSVIWHMIGQTDIISKLVLLLFLGMSIVCWAFTIYKALILKTKVQHLKHAQALLRNIVSLDDFTARINTLNNNFAGEIINNYLADFKLVLQVQENSKYVISDKDWQILQASINQAIEDVIQKEEYYLPVLSTSAQAAPLIGLFGTVWGLIHAFLAIAQQRSSDISAVAPGIAEALITTLAGLVVAIPALIMFSYLQSKVKLLEQKVITLSDNCVWVMRTLTSANRVNINSSSQSPFISSVSQEIRKEIL